MSYIPINDSEIAPGAPGSQFLFQRLRDNLIAALAGDAAAPRIQTAAFNDQSVTTAKLADGAITTVKLGGVAIHQGQLATASGIVSQVGSSSGVLTLPGGAYGFYPQVRSSASMLSSGTWKRTGITMFEADTNSFSTENLNDLTTSYVTTVTITAPSGTTGYAQQTYVAASPPYDLGDGEIGLFVFARIARDGTVLSTYIAADPPWANNGPTRITPDLYVERAGRLVGYQRRRVVPHDLHSLRGPERLAALRAAPLDLIEVTQELKHADMGLVPHPFAGLGAGERVVLLDPPATHDLLELHQSGDALAEHLHNGHIIISTTALPRATPHGVTAHGWSWK